MDAFPDYTRFDMSKKVLAAVQIIATSSDEQELRRASTDSNHVERNGMIYEA